MSMPPKYSPRQKSVDPTTFRRKAVRLPRVNGLKGLPVDGDAPERRRKAEPLNQIVTRLLEHYDVRLSDTIAPILKDWPELAGHDLATKVRPGKLERGILYVYARNSVELFEIRRFKLRGLEARIKNHPNHQKIRQVRLQLDPDNP